MNDREMLELAAKAAGMTGWAYKGLSGMHKLIDPSRPETTGSIGPAWNPLTDDGDALRLACATPMMAGFDMQYLFACAWQATENHEERCAYVRRKIVETVAKFTRAAAEIARAADAGGKENHG